MESSGTKLLQNVVIFSSLKYLSCMKRGRGEDKCHLPLKVHIKILSGHMSVKLCSTSVRSFVNGGILNDYLAYPALYLGGTPSQETSTSPPSRLLPENRLYILEKLVLLIFGRTHYSTYKPFYRQEILHLSTQVDYLK